MKLTKSLWQTYKEVPADAEIPSHQLMMRAGLIHKSGSGLYSYLPFAYRSIQKINQIVREELSALGCQEIQMSVISPAELWKESGRWEEMSAEMLTMKDKAGRELSVSPTNEEVIVDIFRKNIKSYKQLPQTLFQINTKFRDEIRPRFGLMRAREFTMKDAYSFHVDKECLDLEYDRMFKAYENILSRLGLEFSAVVADGGAMASSDSKTHEFQVIADTGEDEIIYSKESGYAANIEKAQTKRKQIDFLTNEASMVCVETIGMKTLEEVCDFLKIEKFHSIKSLIYKYILDTKEYFCLVGLLGDDSINEIKLASFLNTQDLTIANDREIEHLGMISGYIGPQGQSQDIKIILDSEIDIDCSFVVGANKNDEHIQNFKASRDIASSFERVDLRTSRSGDLTLDGKSEVKIRRGIEVGHIFQLGDKYTKSMKASILDQNGKACFPLMGCYGLGVTRILAACVEQNYDENGIVWPSNIAPYQVQFVAIAKSEEVKELAEEVYGSLLESKIEVLYDDRKAGPGFKFKDADLLGLPLQVVLGERDYLKDGMLEIRMRKSGEKIKVKKDNLLEKIEELLKGL